MLTVNELAGLWTRSLKTWSDGRRDTSTQVGWLQATSLYADLRQPAGGTQCGGARCLRDLTMEDCRLLAAQEGFAGAFVARGGDVFEWLRIADYQPARADRDIGRLFWQGDILVEEGLQGEYLEHWNRDASLATTPCAAMTLQDATDDRWGTLLRCGEMFMYVRDRAVAVRGTTLAEVVQAAPSLAKAQDVVDFEISFGTISGGGWLITRSTLPYRESVVLRHTLVDDRLVAGDLRRDGTAFQRSWIITGAEGDTSALFDGNSQSLQ